MENGTNGNSRQARGRFAPGNDAAKGNGGGRPRRELEIARNDLDTEHVFSIGSTTEGQLRELKVLSPEMRAEVAPTIDFATTSVREIKAVVEQVKTGNMGVHFSSESAEWYTPPEIINRTLCVFGEIDLDPCSNAGPSPNVPARERYTQETDGLVRCGGGLAIGKERINERLMLR